MTQTMPTYDIFLSYAPADEAWVHGYLLDALSASGLNVLTQEEFRPGVPVLQEYERAIVESRYIVLVLSPAWTGDRFGEFVDLLATFHGNREGTWPVVPLILQPVDLPLRLAHLVAVDATTPERWPAALEKITRLLDAPLAPAQEVPDCPYPGMTPFTTEQESLFFGRDKEITEAVERLGLHPFLCVIGPSGSGKSSLVYAGVIPALRRSRNFGPGAWDVRTMRPGAAPLTVLAAAIGIDAVETQNFASLQPPNPTLLFVDQFEELFTQSDPAQVQPFLDALQTLIGQPNLHILLTVRADFYPELMGFTLWPAVQANRLDLPPLGRTELAAAIVQPAAQVKVSVDPLLVERLTGDAAGEKGALPLVQECLRLLWQGVARRYLPAAAYAGMAEGERNGLQIAIDRRASVVYNNLPAAAQPIARRIFLRLIQFGEGRADTRRQQMVEELRASGDDTKVFDDILDRLTINRLLTTSGKESSGRQVDIAHEALIVGWGLLRDWIAEERENIRFRFQVEDAAKAWQTNGQTGDYLWSGVRLKIADNWSARVGNQLNRLEERFLSESRKRARRWRTLQYSAFALLVILASILPIQWTRNWLLRRSASSEVVMFSAGKVTLGSTDPSDERTFPPREVAVKGFIIDKFEVSYRQYRLCVEARVCSHPREPAGRGQFDDIETSAGNLPVVWVDAYQASTYCKWLGGRLPTEAEWERAARGVSFRPFPWGTRTPEPTDVNVFLSDFPEQALLMPVPVDEPTFKTGATLEGIMHMLGNVSEWTATTDACKQSAYACQGDWNGEDEAVTVYIRGGSWKSDLVSLAYYDSADPLIVDNSIGFRCAW